MLDLYLTTCSRCRATVSADRFVWDRDQGFPVVRTYACPACGHAGDESTDAADRERAASYTRRGLQHALALEQLAPAGDPDREHAEAALAVYPGRAVFALITLLSKSTALDLEPPLRRAADALLLSTFDAANALWSFAEGRSRPRQLTASPHFIETNAWRALEKAGQEWEMDDPGIPLRAWPHDGELEPGTVSVFPGPSRDLAATLERGQVRRVMTVCPGRTRPTGRSRRCGPAGCGAVRPLRPSAWHCGADATTGPGMPPPCGLPYRGLGWHWRTMPACWP